jgi:DinB superfamily
MTTNQLTIPRPQTGEYAPYYQGYISLVSTDDILPVLETQWPETVALLSARKETEGDFRYAPGKWTVKEVLGHVIDCERIFGYRALRIARNDKTPMEGFEQDDYVKNGPFGQCSLASLVEEFESVRQATLSLFRGFDEAAWVRRGVANKNETSVRAIAYIIAGHELHHKKILHEKYFTGQRSKSYG